MSKAIKLTSLVVVIGIVGYVGGSFYAKDMIKKKVDHAITQIEAHHKAVKKIDYQSIHTNLFSLFTHNFSLENVKIYLETLPKNPIAVDALMINDLKQNKQNVPLSFDIGFKDAKLENSNQFIKQSLSMYSNPKSQPGLSLLEGKLDQYMHSAVSGNIQYGAEKKELNVKFIAQGRSGKLADITTTFSNYVIKSPVGQNLQSISHAFSNASIKAFEGGFRLLDLIDGKQLAKQFPQYAFLSSGIDLNVGSSVTFNQANKALTFAFDVMNHKHKNIDVNVKLSNVNIGAYTLDELAKGKFEDGISQAYLGPYKANMDFSLAMPRSDIDRVYPQAKPITQLLGHDQYTLFYQHHEQYSPDTQLETSSMQFGLKNMGELSAHYELSVKGKIMMDGLLKNLNLAASSEKQDVSDVLKNILTGENDYQFKTLELNYSNQSLYQDAEKIYAHFTQQSTQEVNTHIKNMLVDLKEEVGSDHTYPAQAALQEKLLSSLIDFTQSPNELSVQIKPKAALPMQDVSDLLLSVKESYQKEHERERLLLNDYQKKLKELKNQYESKEKSSQHDSTSVNKSNHVVELQEKKKLYKEYLEESMIAHEKFSNERKAELEKMIEKLSFLISSK